MRILGIDTSSKFLCLGIYDRGRIYSYNMEVGRKLSTLLVLTLSRVLDILGWQPADIDYFACGLGPGSFTGMRIGLSALKGFSWALKAPIIGLSSLDILARNAAPTSAKIVMPVIDAKRNLLYCSAYKVRGNTFTRIMPYRLLSQEGLLKIIKPHSVLLGDGAGLHKDAILRPGKAVTILDKDHWSPRPHNLIPLALECIKQKKFSGPFGIKPIYLYPKECQIKAAANT